MKKLVSVFGPSACEQGDPVLAVAEELGMRLAAAGFAVVNGGYGGVMEAVSRGARTEDGSVIGVIAEVYHARGREPNEHITREIKVKSANDALMELVDIADAYIAVGNSTGTLLEVITAWDYMTKRFIPAKPLILIGEEWKAFYNSIASDTHFAAYLHHITLCESTDEAMKELRRVFGQTRKLPDLNILS